MNIRYLVLEINLIQILYMYTSIRINLSKKK